MQGGAHVLTPDFAYHHEITLERFTGRDINKNTYAPPVTLRGRVNFANKRTWLRTGQAANEIVASGTVFLPASAAENVAPEDRISFNGKQYKVVSAQPAYWIDGKVTHVEVVIL